MVEVKRIDKAQIGDEFEVYEFVVTPEFNQQYIDAVEDYHPRYLEIVHPALLVNHSNIPRTPSFNVPLGMAAVHTQDEIEFINKGKVGKRFRVYWKVVDVYEKRGRKYQVKDVGVMDEDGLVILKRRMTDTYFSGEVC